MKENGPSLVYGRSATMEMPSIGKSFALSVTMIAFTCRATAEMRASANGDGVTAARNIEPIFAGPFRRFTQNVPVAEGVDERTPGGTLGRG